MKILWLCNLMLKEISRCLGKEENPFGGWLDGSFRRLLEDGGYELSVVFPYEKEVKGETDGFRFYSFREGACGNVLRSALAAEKPDVVHIFGTEYDHALEMSALCREAGIPAIIGIQGLIGECAAHYFAALPHKIVKRYTFRDFLKRENLWAARKKFEKRGANEAELLRSAEYVIGRTDLDRAWVYALCPEAEYFFCNETLRPSFYRNKWKLENCERHTLFVSQCGYPLKGFHLLLEAVAVLKREYPDIRVFTTGQNPAALPFKERIRRTSYDKYLAELIDALKLQESVRFLGRLKEEEMCDRYLKSHVFVSPSSIENSPNSVGEAMLLGVPSVVSDVGGVRNLFTHETDGLMYPYDEPKVLAYYIKRIFDDDALARRFSENAQSHAAETHDAEKNHQRLTAIYRAVAKGCGRV